MAAEESGAMCARVREIVKSRSRAADFFTLSQTRSVQRLQAIVKHFTSKFHSNNTA